MAPRRPRVDDTHASGLEVLALAGREHGPVCAAGRGDLGIGRADRKPDSLPHSEDVRVLLRRCVVERQDGPPRPVGIERGIDAHRQLLLAPTVGQPAHTGEELRQGHRGDGNQPIR